MPTETFKTDYGSVPKLAENNYPMWREKVRRAIMGTDAYEIVTREGPKLEGNNWDSCIEQRNWRKRRNDARGHPVFPMGQAGQFQVRTGLARE
jgi:hypothetical protein